LITPGQARRQRRRDLPSAPQFDGAIEQRFRRLKLRHWERMAADRHGDPPMIAAPLLFS
jgi:hypothetical protein